MDLGDSGVGLNQFQVRSLSGMAFDLAKAMFVGALVPQLGWFTVEAGFRWWIAVVGATGGIAFVMLGLYLGKGVKER